MSRNVRWYSSYVGTHFDIQIYHYILEKSNVRRVLFSFSIVVYIQMVNEMARKLAGFVRFPVWCDCCSRHDFGNMQLLIERNTLRDV